MNQLELIRKEIEKALPGAEVTLSDPRNDGIHLEAVVVAKQFRGLSLVQQHKLVMNALKESFETSLHALGLKTKVWDE